MVSWALNDQTLADVVTAHLELNLSSGVAVQSGTLPERIRRVQHGLERRKARLLSTLDSLMQRRSAETNPERRSALAAQIMNLDTRCRMADRAFQMTAGIAYRAYRLGENSVAIATALGLTPAHVRQVIFRLNRVAELLGFDVPPVRTRPRRKRLSARARATKAGIELSWARRRAKAAELGVKVSSIHLERTGAKRLHDLRITRRETGLCPVCGGKPLPGRIQCGRCAKGNRERNRAHAKARVTPAGRH